MYVCMLAFKAQQPSKYARYCTQHRMKGQGPMPVLPLQTKCIRVFTSMLVGCPLHHPTQRSRVHRDDTKAGAKNLATHRSARLAALRACEGSTRRHSVRLRHVQPARAAAARVRRAAAGACGDRGPGCRGARATHVYTQARRPWLTASS